MAVIYLGAFIQSNSFDLDTLGGKLGWTQWFLYHKHTFLWNKKKKSQQVDWNTMILTVKVELDACFTPCNPVAKGSHQRSCQSSCMSIMWTIIILQISLGGSLPVWLGYLPILKIHVYQYQKMLLIFYVCLLFGLHRCVISILRNIFCVARWVIGISAGTKRS